MTDARACAARTATRAALRGLGLLALLAGCGSDLPTGLQCVPGRAVTCACPGGGDGYQSCAVDGAFGPCTCFAGGGLSGSGGTGGAGGSGDDYVTPGANCQILGATAACDCGDVAGKSGCFSYETGPAWSTCRCPELPQGGSGGSAGAAGSGGAGGTGGTGGFGGASGTGGFGGGGTGGFGTGGFGGGTGGTGGGGSVGSCPGSLQCLFNFCTEPGGGNLPSCAQAGQSCMGTGTCVQNSGSGGLTLVCFISCTP